MLEVDGIDTYYGQSHVLHDVSLEVGANEVVGVVGRNGVGKTTTLRSIMGLTPPRRGRITFDGTELTGLKPNRIAGLGIGFVPQSRRLFAELTVLENLKMGFGTNALDQDRLDAVYERFPRLQERQSQKAGTLSGGEQQMAALARVLVNDPALLLLDEPTEGLMPTLVEEISRDIAELAESGYAILLVEQHVDFILDVSDRIYFMEKGRIQDEATAEAVKEDDALFERYLGIGR